MRRDVRRSFSNPDQTSTYPRDRANPRLPARRRDQGFSSPEELVSVLTVTFAAEGPGSVVDEIMRRAWLSGARLLAVRRDDVPGGGDIAGTLRYTPTA
ncbi:hypothetical protein [Amycolatopsis methanolica]|uniref:Uncharacterized protein n=1 Tax=Amycolatopsis methanolica 239 TaxID=1068978 RepID=A0A076MTE2_AMYME|nr:hypothetical protein [Amycolatopsis methanolica]AIJ23979.1 hypothetical protein AMETH_3887 [Amycolatopsis methanolica 239]